MQQRVRKRDDHQVSPLVKARPEVQAPLKPTPTGDLSRLSDAVTGVPKAAPSQRRILLSEDSSVNRRVAVEILRNLGYQVTAVSNGSEALRAAGQSPYDLIILDCETPEMDGYEAAAAIRALPGETGRRVPIIGLTAESTTADREKRQAAGMNDYIIKPVRPQTVASVLARWDAAAHSVAPPLAVDRDVLTSLAAIAGAQNPTLVDELIELFLGSTPLRIAELRQALKKKDAKRLREVAHDLRGSSGQLGATRMEQTCASIETLARTGGLKGVREFIDQLDPDLERVGNDLRTSARERRLAVLTTVLPSSTQCDLAMLRAALEGKSLLVVHDDAAVVSELEEIFGGTGCSVRSVRLEDAPFSGDVLFWATTLDELARLQNEGLRVPVIVLAKDPDGPLLDRVHGLGADFALQPCQAADLQLRTLLKIKTPLPKPLEEPVAEVSNVQEVLVAEDDPLIARFVVSNLEGAGFRTTLVTDGDAALEAFSRKPFHVVILDINMPKTDGFGVLSQLRLRPESHRTPVLMLSARSQEHDIVKAFDLGADDYVTKPFNPLELVTRVRRLTRRS
jgi:CheY-like chemotaxis protein